jgi:hypothetical protein
MASKKKSVPPEQFDKENAVLELRRSGETWQRIAQVVGYANASGAQKAYSRIVNRVQRESVEEIRDLELDRLDRIMRAYWKPAIVDGDKKAADLVLKVIDRRAKLLGLDAPQKLQAEVVNYDGNTNIDADIERIMGLLNSASHSVPLSLETGTSSN